jgi:hypothetical protein
LAPPTFEDERRSGRDDRLEAHAAVGHVDAAETEALQKLAAALTADAVQGQPGLWKTALSKIFCLPEIPELFRFFVSLFKRHIDATSL